MLAHSPNKHRDLILGGEMGLKKTLSSCKQAGLIWCAGELLEPEDVKMDRTTLGHGERLEEEEEEERNAGKPTEA